VTNLFPHVLFKSTVLSILGFQTSEISTLKLCLPPNSIIQSLQYIDMCPQQINGCDPFGSLDFEKLNFQPSLSLELQGFMLHVLLDRTTEIHFGSLLGVHGFSPHVPLNLTTMIYFGFLPGVHKFSPCPSGSDGPY
jgi:hypothetical protein